MCTIHEVISILILFWFGLSHSITTNLMGYIDETSRASFVNVPSSPTGLLITHVPTFIKVVFSCITVLSELRVKTAWINKRGQQRQAAGQLESLMTASSWWREEGPQVLIHEALYTCKL